MTLTKNGLGAIVVAGVSSTQNVVVVAGDKNVYVRGLLLYNTSLTDDQTIEIHVVPNDGSGGVGAIAAGNKIGRLALSAMDTAFFEFPYPLTLTDTGDSIRVVNGAGSSVNVLPIGDKES